MSQQEPRDYEPAHRIYLIVTDAITDSQRNQIHDMIKTDAVAWWHHFANAWIVVGGPTASYWVDKIQPFVEEGLAQVLVFRLQEGERGQTWTGFADLDTYPWLRKHVRDTGDD